MAGSWYLQLAEPRLNVDENLSCNQFITRQIAPVVAETFITFDAQQIIDSNRYINITETTRSGCTSRVRKLLADRKEPFSTYTASIIPVTTESCDVINDAQQKCTVSILLQSGSMILRTMQVVGGISKFDMWLDMGGIVGAIQYYAWIFTEIGECTNLF